MGILDRLASGLNLTTQLDDRRGVVSPWSGSGTLASIEGMVAGTEFAPITRAEAMRVPAVAKARAVILATLAKQPLRVYDGDTAIADQPAWTTDTSTQVAPWHRMAWVLDDLFFHGWSLLAKRRAGGAIDAMLRVPFEAWRFDTFGRVEVRVRDEWVVPAGDEVVLIPGPQEGILDIGADTIRGARAVERTILDRARTPYSAIDIRHTDGTVLEGDEIDELIDDYIASRRDVDGSSIGYVPVGVELNYHGEKPEMLIEARNAYRLDVAAFADLPGQLLDASLSTASLTYSTKEGARNELLDFSLSFWADPIAGRLSLDDVVEPGLSVRFDLTEFTATVNPGVTPVTED